MANVNTRKELEKTRKSMKNNKDTENAQPLGKANASSSKRLDRKKRGWWGESMQGKELIVAMEF